MVMIMPEEVLSLTDTELLQHILLFAGGIFIMKVCEWVVTVCKWVYGWLASMFPTN